MNPTLSATMATLAPHLQAVHEVIAYGPTLYDEYPPQFVVDHDPTTRANCIHSHIRARARLVLDSLPNVRTVEMGGLSTWAFDDLRIVLRFKKTDPAGSWSNIRTKQTKAYDMGDELPGMPEKYKRLVGGYVLDDTGVFVRSQIMEPASVGSSLWCAAIIPAEDGSSAASWEEVIDNRTAGLGL